MISDITLMLFGENIESGGSFVTEFTLKTNENDLNESYVLFVTN